MLTNEETKALVLNRIRRSRETWDETKGIIEGCYWYAAANRMYYACYYAAEALLAKHHITVGTHAGVKTMLGLHFVSKGLISKESGRAFSNLYDSRQRGDYDEFVYSTKEEVDELYPKALQFIKEVESLLVG